MAIEAIGSEANSFEMADVVGFKEGPFVNTRGGHLFKDCAS